MIFYTGYNCDLESGLVFFFFFFGKVKSKVVVRRLFFVDSRYIHGYDTKIEDYFFGILIE